MIVQKLANVLLCADFYGCDGSQLADGECCLGSLICCRMDMLMLTIES